MVNTRLRSGGPWLRGLLAGAIGISFACGLVVWTRIEIRSLRYRASRLLQHETQLQVDLQQLRVEVAALSAAQRIEREARELGLGYPANGQITHLPQAQPGVGARE